YIFLNEATTTEIYTLSLHDALPILKKLLLFMTAVALGTLGTQAAKMDDTQAVATGYRYGNSFIFVENGVTFSVYPDGEFDFYMDNRVNVGIGAQIRSEERRVGKGGG